MRHDNCKCTLVVDWGDPALAGYNEMDYYRIYQDADSVENQKKWVSEWNAMSAEERQRYSPAPLPTEGRARQARSPDGRTTGETASSRP